MGQKVFFKVNYIIIKQIEKYFIISKIHKLSMYIRVSSHGQKCEQTSVNINNFIHELFTL